VQNYLKAAGASTSGDINRRRHEDTKGAKCLDHASLTNDIAEGMFAYQSKAISDGKGGLNRSRGVALCDASHTFELAHLAKKKRRRRFMKTVQRGQAQLSDWVETHREDNNFLNIFNEKHVREGVRRQIIWDAQAGRKTARKQNKDKLVVRDESKLEAMIQTNTTLQTRHANKIAIHYKLRNKPRITSMDALMVHAPPPPLHLNPSDAPPRSTPPPVPFRSFVLSTEPNTTHCRKHCKSTILPPAWNTRTQKNC
jgi:hypothetical protein